MTEDGTHNKSHTKMEVVEDDKMQGTFLKGQKISGLLANRFKRRLRGQGLETTTITFF